MTTPPISHFEPTGSSEPQPESSTKHALPQKLPTSTTPKPNYSTSRQPSTVCLEKLLSYDQIIDVRSPAEYARDHIPGAINCPVLNDTEHAQIGTMYKQVSPFAARRLGAALVSRNIAHHLETSFRMHEKQWRPLVYCWRGGQRSESMALILRQVGWRADKLAGGYKTWRHHVLESLAELPRRFQYHVVTGLTGCGKSGLLDALSTAGAQVLHLEKLACHKGSVLGGHPDFSQPSQQRFETELYDLLRNFDPDLPVFVESESRRIGSLYLPEALFNTFSNSTDIIDLNVPQAVRVAYLQKDYLWAMQRRDWLKQQLIRIAPMHPRETFDRWVNWVDAGDFEALIGELLEQHYDPLYRRSHQYQLNDYQQALHLEISDLSAQTLDALALDLIRATA